MDIRVLDQNFVLVAIIDSFDSFIWTERFQKLGDYVLSISADHPSRGYLIDDNYLQIDDSNRLMIIDTRYTKTDPDTGNTMTYNGYSLEVILKYRRILKQTILDGNLQNEIERVLNENVISPTEDPDERTIPELRFRASTDPRITELTVEVQTTGDYVSDVVEALCTTNNIGWRIVYEEGPQPFVFELYAGVDRSYDQEANPYVVFSPSYDNILNTEFVQSKANQWTMTRVAGEGEGADRITTDVYADPEGSRPKGLKRREGWTDARDISKTVESGQLTDEEYHKELTSRGDADLADHIYIEAFDGEADTSSQYVFDRDYFMGDVVQIQDVYENSAKVRATEYIRSWEASGVKDYPTFSAVT